MRERWRIQTPIPKVTLPGHPVVPEAQAIRRKRILRVDGYLRRELREPLGFVSGAAHVASISPWDNY